MYTIIKIILECFMEIFNQVLFWVHTVILGLCTVAFGIQLLYMFFFFVPPKKYKPAKKQHRFGIIIPARNEEAVIGDTIKCLLKQKYPRELFDIFVVADNCTDKTAEVARAAGAIVFEHFDDDPAHKRASYALKYGFECILKEYDRYDAFIKFDADNLMNDTYIEKMNDAFDAGVLCARGYENSKNLTESIYSGISGLWYIRYTRFTCNIRSFLRTSQMLTGAGMMFSADIIRNAGGWDALSTSDDAEFCMKRLFQGIKSHYVPDAMVYEDQPTTLKDTFNRNKRMGHGIHKLFYKQGIPALGKVVTGKWKLKYSYLDMFMEMLFVPIAVLCCLWMPLYYGYDIIWRLVVGGEENIAYVIQLAKMIGYILLFAYLLPFYLQAILAVILERKKMVVAKKAKLIPIILVFPFFMIIYAIAITVGVLTKPKWKTLKRSTAAMRVEDVVSGGDPEGQAQSEEKESLLTVDRSAQSDSLGAVSFQEIATDTAVTVDPAFVQTDSGGKSSGEDV